MNGCSLQIFDFFLHIIIFFSHIIYQNKFIVTNTGLLKTYWGREREYPRIVTSCDMGGGVYSNGGVTTMYFLNVYILYILNYLPHVSSPTCILAKATEVTSNVWQWVMRNCGDKRSISIGENKTKEDLSTLVNTMNNLLCPFILNDDACIALRHIAIKMKTLHASLCYQIKKHAHIWAIWTVKCCSSGCQKEIKEDNFSTLLKAL